jgi:LDH2 family malate/lactate/ureidoglycolate dehydrogenase
MGQSTLEACLALGSPKIVAEEVVRQPVDAKRAGHGSHVVTGLTMWLDQASRYERVPQVAPSAVNQFGGVALCDAQRGMSYYSSHLA